MDEIQDFNYSNDEIKHAIKPLTNFFLFKFDLLKILCICFVLQKYKLINIIF